jgi:hypothetical protein
MEVVGTFTFSLCLKTKHMIKVILLIIFPFFAYGQIQSTICPVKGDKNSHKFMALDSLKNRRLPGDSATVIPIEAFFSSGNTFTTDMYVQTTGIVKLVK